MKKYLWIFLILILIIGTAIFIFNKNNNEEGYTAERTSIQIDNNQNEDVDFNKNNKDSEQDENREDEKISEFSTKLPNDTKAREDNIKLACKTLNNTVVKKKDIFSLWEILGCPTKEKGYKKAKTFTSEGEITQSYGGGICQISTTLYNAVLKIEELEIKERHEHSRRVSYIKDGKDAAVSYNTADLKFKNTLEYDIKIEAKVEDNKVKIKLVRI